MTRPVGVPNKNKRGLKAQLKRQYGEEFDVVMMMAENCATLHGIAQENKESGVEIASLTATNANNALEKLAQYVEPKLKSVEVSAEVVSMTPEEWLGTLE